MHDLYTLIEKIKKAPSMYLGRHSIICLQAFLSGYSVAKYELGEQPTKQDSDFRQFPEWIRKRFNVQTSQSWANVILFYSEDESKALDRFFELLDEFINRHSSTDTLREEARYPPEQRNSNELNDEKSNSKQTKTLHQDLSEMPELGNFFDRTPSLNTLTTWILQQNCRLITLTGISGIGKTSLAVQLVKQIKDEFEYAAWYTLDEFPTIDKFQSNLTQLFSHSENLDSSPTNQKRLPLIKYLQKHRCLVVLDDIHNLFCSGELAGKYKPDYEEYRSLFKQIEKLSHPCCFLLIGWEPPKEVPQLTSENTPIRTLQLTGLDTAAAGEILRDKGLTDIDNCEALFHRYQGNPLWLKSVATLIQELGIGATELLIDDTILLPEDLKDVLQQQYDRTSELEKQVMSLLATENQPVNVANLLQNGQISSSDLLNALQSLSRRCSIEKQESLYTLPPVLKQYIKGL